MTTAVIPGSVEVICSDAFYATPLTSVKLSEGLQAIETRAFSSTKLTEIDIPASVTTIFCWTGTGGAEYTNGAFAYASLKKITIGGAITSIPKNMFSCSSTLEELVLREGVTEIGLSAFDGYTELKKVTLPTTLTTIGGAAFYLTSQLTAVITGPNLNSIGSNAFYRSTPTFYRLPGTDVNEWLAAWCLANGFTYDTAQHVYITVTFDDALDETEDTVIEVDAYSLLNEPLSPAREGYSFLGWFDGNGDEPWDFADDHTGAVDLTLTARWLRETANGLYRVEDGCATLISYALSDEDSTVVAVPPTWQGYPVTAVADGAFAGERVTMITLPASVVTLSGAAFAGAEDLHWIGVQSQNPAFSSRSGILFTKDGSTLLFFPEGRSVTEYTVPGSVTVIAENAFASHDELQSVSFSEALTQIGAYAFFGCGLTQLNLPQDVQSIETGAFSNCYSLLSVRGAEECTRIGDNAFASTGLCIFYGDESSALVRYAVANGRPYNIYRVGYMLDGEEIGFTRLKAGDPVPQQSAIAPEERVLVSGWYTDAELTQSWDFAAQRMPMSDLVLYAGTLPLFETEAYQPQVPEGETAPAAGLRVTAYNGNDTTVRLPQTLDGLTVYAVDAAAFTAGTALYLPAELWEIDVAAFVQAGIVLYAPIGSVTEQLLLDAEYTPGRLMHTLSFESNGGALVAAIDAESGSEVTLPDAVRDGCELSGWYSDKALSSFVGAADDSFTMPDADVTLYAAWDGEAPEYAFTWEQRGQTAVITGSLKAPTVVIPASINGLPVTAIEQNAFNLDETLVSITLPDGLVEIGEFAFSDSGLTEIVLPDTVTSVGQYAFASCRNLVSCTWSSSAGVLSRGVFNADGALTNLTLPEGVVTIDAHALDGCGLTELVLPDSVTEIRGGAFGDMTKLASVSIGQNVTAFAADALDGCTALQRIDVTAGNTHYESVDGVLYYADSAGLVRYPAGLMRSTYTVDPSAMLIESRAFADTKALGSVVLPDELVQLGSAAFKNSSISEMDMTGLALLTEIPAEAFEGCRSLSSVILPDGLTQINAEAFAHCGSLAEINIPDAVYFISDGAFDGGIRLIVGSNTLALRYAQRQGLAYRLRGQMPIPAQTITADKAALTLMTGVSYTLSVTLQPSDTTDAVIWRSEDATVLRVDDGLIRPIKHGETEIIVSAGEATLSIPVRVNDYPAEIVQPTTVVYSSSPLQLTLVYADNVAQGTVQWECTEASVSEGGVLSATQTGMAAVRVSMPGAGAFEREYACILNSDALFLPRTLKTVGPNAFRASAASAFILPDGIRSIDAGAFADCANLKLVLIPTGVSDISDTAFDNSFGIIIVCQRGSAAEEYAQAHDMRYILIP